MNWLAGILAVAAVGVAVLATVSTLARWRFRRHRAAFVCRVRRPVGRGRRRWQRRRAAARWVHDVLVLQSGPVGVTAEPLAARIPAGAVLRQLPSSEVGGLGRHPVALLFATEEDGPVELAVRAVDRDVLVGPYLLAAMPGRRDAPREHGP